MKRILLSAYGPAAFNPDFPFTDDKHRDLSARNSAASICALLSHYPFASSLADSL